MNKLLKIGLAFLICYIVSNSTSAREVLKNTVVFTPVEYGAKPNDDIDDSDAFQCCLDEARKMVGTKIVIPPGRYLIGKELRINETNTLFIEGDGAVLAKPSGNGSNIFYGNYNKQITIRNLTFEGNRVAGFKEKWPERMNACAIIGRSSGIRFENCVVRDFHYGVCLGTSTDNGYDVWVVNCQFENCHSDIDLYGKPSVHIVGNSSHNCTGHSIQIEPPYKREDKVYDYRQQKKTEALSIGNIISGNVIDGCKGVGIIVFSGCEDLSVTNNQMINFGTTGMLIHEGASNIKIDGNIISNSTYSKTNERPWKNEGAGIVVSDANNVVITGNIIYHANTGIYISGTKGAIISNNKVSESKDAGICFYKASGCILLGNAIDNYNLSKSWWANSGMVLYASSDIAVYSTMITDNASNPYSVYCERSNVDMQGVVGKGFTKSFAYPATLNSK